MHIALTSIIWPSLVSSRVHDVSGPSPFCSVCSHVILLSVSHFGKLWGEIERVRQRPWARILFYNPIVQVKLCMYMLCIKYVKVFTYRVIFTSSPVLLTEKNAGIKAINVNLCDSTVHGRPSTVVSLKDWPTVKDTWVVRTLVDVWIERLSPCCAISTAGLEAAATAIFLRKTFTPKKWKGDLSEQWSKPFSPWPISCL